MNPTHQEVIPMDPITSSTGHVRLRIQTTQHAPMWATVGPLNTLAGARRLAEDLIATETVRAVRIEHRQRSTWKPAWSWLGGLVLLLIVSLGCATPGKVSTDIWHSLTPEQRAEADAVEAALGKLKVSCLAEH